jgi:hypothetical protein
MTCIRFGSAIVCVSPWGRLRLGNRYVWVDFHEYCGPSFYWDSAMTKGYDPADENDPIWDEFGKWLKKYQEAQTKRAAQLRAKKNAAAAKESP